jgi:hypothetical protein
VNQTHTFKLGRRWWEVRLDAPLGPFLFASTIPDFIDLVCSCVTEPDVMRPMLEDGNVYITVEQLTDLSNWLIEVICERDIEHAVYVWEWGRSNLLLVEGRLLNGTRTFDSLTAREFYALTYTLMMDEAGSRANLEKQLDEWVANAKMLAQAKQGTERMNPKWDEADRMAMELLAGV